MGKPDNSQQIGFREPDPNCEVCSEISVSHCCCFVESVEQTTDIDLHICGVLAPINELCAGTGHGCYAVGTSGIHVSLSYLDRQYFCIAQNANFSLYNANGFGHGLIRVGCSSSYEPHGDIGTDLNYITGAYHLFFETSGCEVQTPCPY